MASFLAQSLGPYLTSFDSTDIGDVEGPIRFQTVSHADIVRASRYGRSPIDLMFAGRSSFVVLTVKEWSAATKKIFWPWDTDLGLTGAHGRLASDGPAKVLLLTAIAGSPAATLGPVTRSCPLAVFAPEFNQELVLGVEQRDVAMTLILLPTEVSATTSSLRHFTDT